MAEMNTQCLFYKYICKVFAFDHQKIYQSLILRHMTSIYAECLLMLTERIMQKYFSKPTLFLQHVFTISAIWYYFWAKQNLQLLKM